MGALHEFRIRHNKFTANIDKYIEGIIDDNQQLLDLNRSQLKDEHKTINDTAIVPPYSSGYAQFKGFKTPDLYLSGDMFNEMSITTKGKQYFIKSGVDYYSKLVAKYKDTFGIAKSKQPKAKQITTEQLLKEYKAICYSK
jgi:hypothetical protein